jgi:hypothetical protein
VQGQGACIIFEFNFRYRVINSDTAWWMRFVELREEFDGNSV